MRAGDRRSGLSDQCWQRWWRLDGSPAGSAGLHLLHVLHDLLLDLGHLLGGAELEVFGSGLGPLEVSGRHVEGWRFPAGSPPTSSWTPTRWPARGRWARRDPVLPTEHDDGSRTATSSPALAHTM